VSSQITADAEDQTIRAEQRSGRFLRIPAPRPVIGSLAAAGVAQLALVVTGVVTARSLGPTDRGYLALVILVPIVLHIVGAIGLPRATTYFIASDPAQEDTVIRAIRLPIVVQAAVLTLLQIAIFSVLLEGDPASVKWAGAAVVPLLWANLVEAYCKAVLQGERRYGAFNILRSASIIFYLVGVVLVAAFGQAGLVQFAIAYVVANVLSAAVTLAVVAAGRKSRPAPPTPVTRRSLLRFGLRGYLVSLSPIGTFRLDQALIGFLLPAQALGMYVVGLSFTNLPTFISRSIGMIAYPQVAAAPDARADEMSRFFWFSIVLTGGVVVVLEIAAGWLVPLFFGDAFEEAVVLTRILLLGAFFDGARRVLTDTSSGEGRPGLGSIAELTSWLVLVPALIVLMPIWDEEGVAVATTISSAASFVVSRYDER
jgi:O-antigen/teichoic acid export membrane protein